MKLLPLVNSDICAIVDDDIYDAITFAGGEPRIDAKGYVSLGGKKLHEIIMGKHPANKPGAYTRVKRPYTIDHKNGVKHDCRRENLRWATWSQNNANRPPRGKLGLKGVMVVSGKKYQAYIYKDYKRITIGVFSTIEEAAAAYNAAALIYHGPYAWLNPLPNQKG